MKVFFVAGEASADAHAAQLLRELKKIDSTLYAYGVGGERLAQAGMDVVVSAKALNVVGVSDWFHRAGEVVSSYLSIKKLIKQRRPDIAVLLDLPDMNLLLAKHLKRLDIPIVYYISPQVWAWRKYRMRKIKRLVTKMLVVFPFEKEFYEKEGVDVAFVGHPLLDAIVPKGHSREEESIQKAPTIALLPGSRQSEIRYHVPILNTVIAQIRSRYSQANFVVPVAPTLSIEELQQAFWDPKIELTTQKAMQVYQRSDIAVIASGTATLEAALTGTPFCLFYRVSASSAWIFRTFAKYRDYIGMPNLLLKEEVGREFFQEEATAENIAGECLKMLEDPTYRQDKAQKLLGVRKLLGQRGASARAAAQVYGVLKELREGPGFGLAPQPSS